MPVAMLALACVLGGCVTTTRPTPADAARLSDGRLCSEMHALADSYTDTTRYGGYTNLEDVKLRLAVISAEIEKRGLECGS